MRTIYKTSAILVFLFAFSLTKAQVKTTTATSGIVPTDQTLPTKAQNNNTVKSNRTDGKTAIGQPNPGILKNDNNTALSKKGYDYYKAKSDMNAAGLITNPKDQISSGSTKTIAGSENKSNSGTDKSALNQGTLPSTSTK